MLKAIYICILLVRPAISTFSDFEGAIIAIPQDKLNWFQIALVKSVFMILVIQWLTGTLPVVVSLPLKHLVPHNHLDHKGTVPPATNGSTTMIPPPSSLATLETLSTTTTTMKTTTTKQDEDMALEDLSTTTMKTTTQDEDMEELTSTTEDEADVEKPTEGSVTMSGGRRRRLEINSRKTLHLFHLFKRIYEFIYFFVRRYILLVPGFLRLFRPMTSA